jgi:hypothetical protein
MHTSIILISSNFSSTAVGDNPGRAAVGDASASLASSRREGRSECERQRDVPVDGGRWDVCRVHSSTTGIPIRSVSTARSASPALRIPSEIDRPTSGATTDEFLLMLMFEHAIQAAIQATLSATAKSVPHGASIAVGTNRSIILDDSQKIMC